MSEISVTFKYDKGYDAPWAVFKGAPADVRVDIIQFFGFDPSALDGNTLNEVVTLATAKAHGMANAAAQLGAVAISSPVTTVTSAPQTTSGDAWDQVEGGSSATPVQHPVFAEIEAATNVDDLKLVYARNADAFADKDVELAYKTKGRALVAAAA